MDETILSGIIGINASYKAMREVTVKAADVKQPSVAAAYMLAVNRAPKGGKTLIPSDYDLWVRAAEASWKMTNVTEVLLL